MKKFFEIGDYKISPGIVSDNYREIFDSYRKYCEEIEEFDYFGSFFYFDFAYAFIKVNDSKGENELRHSDLLWNSWIRGLSLYLTERDEFHGFFDNSYIWNFCGKDKKVDLDFKNIKDIFDFIEKTADRDLASGLFYPYDRLNFEVFHQILSSVPYFFSMFSDKSRYKETIFYNSVYHSFVSDLLDIYLMTRGLHKRNGILHFEDDVKYYYRAALFYFDIIYDEICDDFIERDNFKVAKFIREDLFLLSTPDKFSEKYPFFKFI